MAYLRLPADAFFSDFVLMPLESSSFGAFNDTCSFVTVRRSRRFRFRTFIRTFFVFSFSAKAGAKRISMVGDSRFERTSAFSEQLRFVAQTFGAERTCK